jgi:hypothetical protein
MSGGERVKLPKVVTAQMLDTNAESFYDSERLDFF